MTIISVRIIIAALTVIYCSFAMLFIVDIISFLRSLKRLQENNDKKRGIIIHGLIKIIFIALAIYPLNVIGMSFISEIKELDITNLALLLGTIILIVIYIIISLIIIIKKREGTVKLERIAAIIAILIVAVASISKTSIENIISPEEYEEYYNYLRGDHAYIESVIEREENA